MPPPEATLAPSEIDTLHILAEDLRTFPDRRNTMAAQVAEDLTPLATAAEARGDQWRQVIRRWPFDDSFDFLDYAIVVAKNRDTPDQVMQRTAARVILRRLMEVQRADRSSVWESDVPADPNGKEPA
jgi:hypothetical protein